jgi:hypothetical protein
VLRCELGSKRCAEAGAVGNDGVGIDVTGLDEVVEGGGGVLLHAELGWMSLVVAGAEAAVVEGEDVDWELMKLGKGWEVVGQPAGAVGEVEDGRKGTGRVLGWEPDADEMGLTGLGGSEAEELDGEGGGEGWVLVRMQEELPLALVDEQAESQVGTEKGGGDGDGGGLQEPAGIDDFMVRRGGAWWRLARRFRHLRHCEGSRRRSGG